MGRHWLPRKDPISWMQPSDTGRDVAAPPCIGGVRPSLLPSVILRIEQGSGASLRAVRAKEDGMTEGGEWGREGRDRVTEDVGQKQRWLF